MRATTTKKALAEASADFLALYVAEHSSVVNVVKTDKRKYKPSLSIVVLGRFA